MRQGRYSTEWLGGCSATARIGGPRSPVPLFGGDDISPADLGLIGTEKLTSCERIGGKRYAGCVM